MENYDRNQKISNLCACDNIHVIITDIRLHLGYAKFNTVIIILSDKTYQY